MTKPTSPADQLHAAVNALIAGRRTRVPRDTGTQEWTTLPSLWAQLREAIGSSNSDAGGASGRQAERSPADVDALDLANNITRAIATSLAEHNIKPHHGIGGGMAVPESLRTLAATVIASGSTESAEQWAAQVSTWVYRAKRVLGLLDDPQPRRMRDTACPACGATHVTIRVDGDKQRVPPLVIDFENRLVRSAYCDACNASWWRHELEDLADQLGMPRLGAEASS